MGTISAYYHLLDSFLKDEDMMQQEEYLLLENFGKRVRFYRRLQKITQEQLGELASVSYKYIGEIERGRKKVSIVVMYRIAKALGVSLCDLVNPVRDNVSNENMKCTLKLQHLLKDKCPSLQQKVIKMVKVFLETYNT